MNRGELLTRITIWIATGGYAVSVAVSLFQGRLPFRERRRWQARARWAWTLGCLGLVAHTVCAFHFYHHWSQASAYRETARQTAEVTGMNWGGGLFINYAFLAAWIGDVAWWWLGLDAYRRRSWLITAIWQGIFIFMLFNATVVFKTGVVRALGFGLFLALALFWWLSLRGRGALDPEGMN